MQRVCDHEASQIASGTTMQRSLTQLFGDTYSPSVIQPLFKRSVRRIPQFGDNLNTRSLCSWNWVKDIETSRIPSIMFKAVCDLNNGGNQCNFAETLQPISCQTCQNWLIFNTECATVHTRVEVLREYCEDGNYKTKSEWIEWPVACTCARKRIRTYY